MIQLENIQFGYTKNRNIFDDVSLTMETGHIYGLLGKNGAGKTTLLKIISGLHFSKSGSATVLGKNACERNAEVLQDLYVLQEEIYVPHLTLVDFEKAYAPFYPNFSHKQFAEYLHEFEMDGLNQYLDKFSHGQKKKALIAFALATNTKILIMDEPTNGLDIPSKSTFRKVMASAATDDRLVIISTHQVRDLYSLIDMVTILENGRIIMNASTYEITKKLAFEYIVSGDEPENVLYSEDTPRGLFVVRENLNNVDSNLDIELLFNAVISNPEKAAKIFSQNE